MQDAGIKLHLSEVKGPVMDRLQRTHFVEELSGKVYLSQSRAFEEALRDNGDTFQEPEDWPRGMI